MTNINKFAVTEKNYDKQIGLGGFIRGYQRRCLSCPALAAYLNVTEEFLKDAIDYYHAKYGRLVTVDHYVILFEPVLTIIERI
ncbi:MAG: hypothetical protein ACRDBO_15845 [Lachnospiraceae bacterium]